MWFHVRMYVDSVHKSAFSEFEIGLPTGRSAKRKGWRLASSSSYESSQLRSKKYRRMCKAERMTYYDFASLRQRADSSSRHVFGSRCSEDKMSVSIGSGSYPRRKPPITNVITRRQADGWEAKKKILKEKMLHNAHQANGSDNIFSTTTTTQ